jgi:hypothetical protein
MEQIDKCNQCYKHDNTGKTECLCCDFAEKYIPISCVQNAIKEIEGLIEYGNKCDDVEWNKRPRAVKFYSKELLDLANEPPSVEELERLRKEIEEWESRTNKFYRSSEDE